MHVSTIARATIVASSLFVLLAVEGVLGSTPYTGTPVSIPSSGSVTIQGEDFDNGGPNDAYNDRDAGNNGGAYRSTDVDLESQTEGVVVGWFGGGEWLRYSATVPTAGYYTISFRVGSASGSNPSLDFSGGGASFSAAVPITGDWWSYTNLVKTGVYLAAGSTVLQVGSTAGNYNLNHFTLTRETASSTPYVTHTVPGRIEAAFYDNGGEGVAYHDTGAGNSGNYTGRGDDVDLENSPDSTPSVGWFGDGEWLQYTFTASTTGSYTLAANVASMQTTGTFDVYIDGNLAIANVPAPNTGDWMTFTDVSRTGIQLSAGQHTLRFVAVTGWFNLNHIDLTTATGPGTTLRVVSFNVQDGGNYAGISGADAQAQFIASFNPDIVLLQETPEGNHGRYRDLLMTYTGRTWYSSGPADTAGILSTFPLEQVERRYISRSSWTPSGLHAVRARITVGGVPLNIWPLHLDIGQPPCWCNGYPDEGMQTVVNWAAESPYNATRRIIGGDINSWTVGPDPAQHRAIEIIRSAGYTDSCLELGYDDYSCPRTTDNNWRPDAVYRSSGLTTTSQSVHPTNLSDHHLLLTVIRIQ